MWQVNPDTNSSCTLLDWGYAWLPTVHVWRQFSSVFCYKRSYQGCFSRLRTPGSAITEIKPFTDVLYRQGFFSLVCQAVMEATWASTTKVYQQCWEGIGRLMCLKECTKQCHICWFLVHGYRVWLAWHTIGIYHLLFQPVWNLIIITRLQIILSSLN